MSTLIFSNRPQHLLSRTFEKIKQSSALSRLYMKKNSFPSFMFTLNLPTFIFVLSYDLRNISSLQFHPTSNIHLLIFIAVCASNRSLSGRYHTGLWSGKRWACCKASTRQTPGCETSSAWATSICTYPETTSLSLPSILSTDSGNYSRLWNAPIVLVTVRRSRYGRKIKDWSHRNIHTQKSNIQV